MTRTIADFIEAAMLDSRPRTWHVLLSSKAPDVAQELRQLIDDFYDGKAQGKIANQEHLARVVSLVCENEGVKITVSGFKTWSRRYLSAGRNWQASGV